MISIALGMDPDQRYMVQDRMSTKMARRITNKCRSSSTMPFATAHNVLNEGYLGQLIENGKNEIEIFGAYENLCIMSLVRHALGLDMNIIVPKKHIVRSRNDAPGLIRSLEEMNEKGFKIVPFKYTQDSENYFIRSSNELPMSYLS